MTKVVFPHTDCKWDFPCHRSITYLLLQSVFWHRKFATADVTAVFVSNQCGIHRQGQAFDK